MRIECGSCGAKYSIADEKVFGKVFKVRCKKCGAMINVDGTSMGDEADEATRVFDMNAREGQEAPAPAAGAEWYVVIEEEQAGPFSTPDVQERIGQQMLDADSFAWKEGMDDWERLADIDEFASAFPDLSTAPSPFTSEPEVMKEEATRVVSSSEGILGSGEPGAAPVESFPSGGYASVPSSEAGSFASAAGAASGESDDDIFSSVASEPREQAAPSFVGARSESSVLFSLDSLTGVRSKDDKSGSAAVPRTEESGLINLEALIATRSQGGDAAASAPAGGPVAAASPATIAIGASSLPKPADRSRVAIIALLVVLLLAIPLTGVAVWLLIGSSEEVPVAEAPEAPAAAEAPAEAEPPVEEEPAAVAEAEPEPEEEGDEEQVVAVSDDDEEEEAEEEAARAEAAAARERTTAAERSPTPAAREETAARAEPAPTPTREAARTTERQPAPAPTTTRREEPAGDDRVSSVLRAVRGEEEQPEARERSAPQREARPQPSGLPEQLTRDDVAVTVRNYGRQITRCKQSDDHAGVYVGRWVIQPSGSVTNAQVNNMNETGQCILGVIRNFSFPRFTGDPITIPRFNFTIN